MTHALLPDNENERLQKLESYAVLDSLPEPTFERVTNMAARLFGVPMALVSLVDKDRQWFKSCFGVDVRQTDRNIAFCAHAILTPDVMVVPDVTLDARFCHNPLVTGPLQVRFYAGAPLKTSDGFNLGSLCIIDTKPRQMTPDETATLADLASVVVDALETRSALGQMHNLASIVEQSQDAIYSRDLDGTISSWNPGAEQMFGFSSSEIIGQLSSVLVPEERRGEFSRVWERVKEGEEVGQFETVRRRKDGTLVDVSLSVSPLLDAGGNIRASFTIARDISHQKRAETELRAAHDAAQSATRAKSEFLANMSHEIRTPMNGVLGTLGLILDTHLTPAQRELAEISRASADTLLTIINDILDFSKIEAGQMTIEPISFDLLQTTEEVMGMIAPRAQEKALELIMRYPPDVARYVVGDPGRIRQVLTNLVSNAIKFTAQGHVLVDIEAKASDENQVLLRIAVGDTGIGIAPDKIEGLWKKFTQADASTTRRFGGTGLGLAISKQLVELMGGTIGAQSEPDEGSTFWFELPLPLDEREAHPALPRADLTGIRTLVVDDNEVNRRVLHEQLSNWRLRSETCASGEEALRVLHEAREAGDPFGIAVLDFQMPHMDGEMLGRVIKSTPLLRETALMMLSSLGQLDNAGHLKRIGFGAYLMKPARQSELLEALSQLWTCHLNGENRDLITRQSVSAARSTPRTPRLAIDHAHHRVLVAEDNSANQKIASMMLQSLGCSVDVAANGREAVEMLSSYPYDVVFMDCEMPVMDGFEATAAIRALGDAKSKTPIIAVTAQAMSGDRERCLTAGMDDYLTKPVQAKDFARALERWTSGSDLLEETPSITSEVEELKRVQLDLGAHASGAQKTDSNLTAERTSAKLDAAKERALPTPPVLDADVMASLRSLAQATDMSLLEEIIEAFRGDSKERLVAIREAIRNENAEVLRQAAHALKGASANIGARRMTDLSQQLQAQGESGLLDEATTVIDDLEQAFADVESALEAELERVSL